MFLISDDMENIRDSIAKSIMQSSGKNSLTSLTWIRMMYPVATDKLYAMNSPPMNARLIAYPMILIQSVMMFCFMVDV